MKILIADDSNTSRMLLKASLSKWGYDVSSAPDGEEAWELLQSEDPPKIAILDWMMPGLNGVELCEKLKNRKNAPYIYIILLTSKSKKKDIVTGLEAGADDFVAKPFDPSELKSRLSVGVRVIKYEALLKENNKQLACYASEMETLANERAKQLMHADRLATLGIMSAEIAHEINNPLTFISSNIQILQKVWGEIEKALHESIDKGVGDKKILGIILEEIPKAIDSCLNGVTRIINIVKGLKIYSHKDRGKQSACSINKSIDVALELSHNILKNHVTVEKHFDDNLPEIKANAQQLEQVFINIFVNAAHAMEAQKKGILKITTSAANRSLYIIVEDTGPGIPENKLKEIWDPFFTTKNVGKGTGLGLSTSKQIIEQHDGCIKAENRPGKGAKFIIELPCPKAYK